MDHFKIIQTKLEAFIKRYYFNELLKGAILFFAIGLLYFLFILFVEYSLWLNPSLRTLLFWLFIFVEFGLFFKFILLPLAKLFKLKKGINYEDASKIIGNHFPEVSDKLLNMLQLHQNHEKSELLIASIKQKSIELSPIPFKLAIKFKKNLSYLKYAVLPIIIILLSFLSGNFDWFSSSYERVVNYKIAYEPPAPFTFLIVNKDLKAIENKDFKLYIKTVGEYVPDSPQIVYNDETYFLNQTDANTFEYVFTQPKSDINFQLQANKVNSKIYSLRVIETPSILDFKMRLDFPEHTNKPNTILKSTGNAIIPEGTLVTWQVNTKSTIDVSILAKDTLTFTPYKQNSFKLNKRIVNDFDYTLSTSNTFLKNHENLDFKLDVIKDEFPQINIDSRVDSLDLETLYFHGKLSDDYGFSKLQLVYYPSDNENNKSFLDLEISNTNYFDFVTFFPNNLNIREGVPYHIYFQVFDNDMVNGFKSTKSQVFYFRKLTAQEATQKQLQSQSESINDFSKSLEKFDDQQKSLKELTQTQREKSSLDFNDKKKLEAFFKRQKKQDEMMKNFNNNLKKKLSDQQNKQLDKLTKDLSKRLEDNEKQLEQDEKLLKELKELQDKISKEELVNKLEKLAKQNANKKRSLKQLLELTKRYYVEKKLQKLNNDLQQLANQQESLSKESKANNTKAKQDKLNDKFNDFKKALDTLQKESNNLKKPIDIPRDKLLEQEINKDQQNASESLKNPTTNNQQKAKQSQQDASKKMKQMSKSMNMSMMGGGMQQLNEDVEMLRQILDNLLYFSFDQERLMYIFQSSTSNSNQYAYYLREQQYLRQNFEHIDDSLFALSLRQPKISERINNEISDVYYNIDKSLTSFADNNLFQGLSSQHFAITSANNLSDYLSELLDNLEDQLSMSSPGQGSEGDMQLPDIIMSQEQLNQMMKDQLNKGKQGESKSDNNSEGSSNEGKQKSKEGKGDDGKEGQEKSPNSSQDSEGNNAKLFQIYQQQQQLRESLNKLLNKLGKGSKSNANALIKQIESIEMDLLNNGFSEKTLRKMESLKHQLFKLKEAYHKQGIDSKRESNSNKIDFNNNTNIKIENAKQYFNVNEILNKQNLPLNPIYKKRVIDYLNTND